MTAPHQPFPVYKYVLTIRAGYLAAIAEVLGQRGVAFAAIPSEETSECFAGLIDLYGRLNTNDATFIRRAIADLNL